MLTESKSKEANDGATGEARSVDSGSRSIAAILERSRARRRRRSHTRAPGFVHGNCRLDALYETFGDGWVEQTAFVEYLPGGGPAAPGWTVARFEDGFATIRHGLGSERDELEAWLAEAVGEVDRAVVLEVGDETSADGLERLDVEVVSVHTTRRRIRELEGHYLGLAREREFGGETAFSPSPCERLLQSRLDVMTLICLCDRLVGPAR